LLAVRKGFRVKFLALIAGVVGMLFALVAVAIEMIFERVDHWCGMREKPHPEFNGTTTPAKE